MYEGYKEHMLIRLGNCETRIRVSPASIVRKLVSTRYNQLEGERSVRCSALKPMVSICTNRRTIWGVCDDNKIAPPSAADLEKAKMYEKDVQ